MRKLLFIACFILVSQVAFGQEEQKAVVQQLSEKTVVIRVYEVILSMGYLKPQILIANGDKEVQVIPIQSLKDMEKVISNLKIIASVLDQVKGRGYILTSSFTTDALTTYIFMKE